MSEETGPVPADMMQGLTEEERRQVAEFPGRANSLARVSGTQSPNPKVRWLAWYYIVTTSGQSEERARAFAGRMVDPFEESSR